MIARRVVGVCRLLVIVVAGQVAHADSAELSGARTLFEQRDYRAAVETLDRLLGSADGVSDALEAKVLRAEALLALGDWDRGVPYAQELLAQHDGLRSHPTLHEALARAGLVHRELRALAVDHFKIAADAYLRQGEDFAAARACLQRAEALIGFNQWDKVTTLQVGDMADDAKSRAVSYALAIEMLERAATLAGDDDLAAEALLRKGAVYESATADPATADLRLRRDEWLGASGDRLAVAAYREAVERCPRAATAPEALCRAADVLERRVGDFVAAAQALAQLIEAYPDAESATLARRRLAAMVDPALSLCVNGPVQPGQMGTIQFHARNVARVTLRAYRVDLFALLRQTGSPPRRICDLAALDHWQPNVEPAATWELTIADDGRHIVADSVAENGPGPTRLPLNEPGAYVIVGTADGVDATTMMLVTDLVCVTKGGRDSSLVYVADRVSGVPERRADVLMIEDRLDGLPRFHEGATDDAGLLQLVFAAPDPTWADRSAIAVARRGEHYAVSDRAVIHSTYTGAGGYRTYTLTDRPLYGAEQSVRYKLLVRWIVDGGYENVTHRSLAVRISDPSGNVVDEQTYALDDYGTIAGEWRVPPDAAPGEYRISAQIDGQDLDTSEDRGARFLVEADCTQEFEVTDAEHRTIEGAGAVIVTGAPFRMQLAPQHAIYRPGEEVVVTVTATTPTGEPFRFRGRARVYALERRAGSVGDDEAEKLETGAELFSDQVTLDEAGRATFRWTAHDEGPVRIAVATQNRAGLTVTGQCDVWIAEGGGRYPGYAYPELALAPDRTAYKPGETARILVNTRFDNAYVLLTTEADEVIDQRIVYVPGGTAVTEWPLSVAHAPNVHVRAVLVRDGKLHEAACELDVIPTTRLLTVELNAGGTVFRPQQLTTIEVRTIDDAGKPVPADVTLYVLDASVNGLQAEFREPIATAFYGRSHGQVEEPLRHGGSSTWRRIFDLTVPPNVDTVLWSAQTRTDHHGRASVDVVFPETLTTWAIRAVVIDQDSRVGEARLDVKTREEIAVGIAEPR